MTEREKMLAGELYDPSDREIVRLRARARDLCLDLNASRATEQKLRQLILQELLGSGGESVNVQPPFHCDYGVHIYPGEKVYFNFGCIVLDVCEVRIGDFTLIQSTDVGVVVFMIMGVLLVLLMVYRPQGLFGNRKEMAFEGR